MYCLKIVKSHGADDSRELFQAMFPDSKMTEKFSLGRIKASYSPQKRSMPIRTDKERCRPLVLQQQKKQKLAEG